MVQRRLTPLILTIGVSVTLTGCSGAMRTGGSVTRSTTKPAAPRYFVPLSDTRLGGHLRVAPGTTVVAGTTLTVSASGPCPSGGVFDVFADLHLVRLPYYPSPTSYDVGASSASLGTAGGAWSATLTVPTNTFPGRYELYALCSDYGPGFLAEYLGQPITISAVGCRRVHPGRNSYEDRPCGRP
jgi:hypothetical protein